MDREDRTHSGAMPNRRAEKRRLMTPKKNDTLSRVRTTLADCHEAEREVTRVVNYIWVRQVLKFD